MKIKVSSPAPVEVSPEEKTPEVARSFKTVQLRLLMREREDVFRKLIDMDYTIWVLEEYFRTGTP